MSNSYHIIYNYTAGSDGAQELYDRLFHAALRYRYRDLPDGMVIPINLKDFTNSIFELNSHDKVPFSDTIINGQKIKELFILTIFLKGYEHKISDDKTVIVNIPQHEGEVDVGIAIFNKSSSATLPDGESVKLAEDAMQIGFQVKEYTDYKRLSSNELITPTELKADNILKMIKSYDVSKLIFLREFYNFSSMDLEDFFSESGDAYLIGVPDPAGNIEYISDEDGTKRTVTLDQRNKHNYIIISSHKQFAIATFKRPRFLIR